MECIYQVKGDFATNIISLCSTMARKGEVDDDYAKAWAWVVVAVDGGSGGGFGGAEANNVGIR